MAAPLRISTDRLDIIAATAPLARADASDRVHFAALLEAAIPASWPPDVMRDVQEFFAEQLEKGFAQPGWWNWYAVRRDDRTLIGNGGFAGVPNDEGIVTLGYSIAEGYEGQGYCTEMVAGLMQWASESGNAKQVFATTFERHFGSIAVLQRNGFVCKGVSSEDAAASEDDRQGRGQLMVWVKNIG
jgi:ribosomal-protein-alanine N-acetyltransferase